jgi:ornithine carbamoyltransferase
MKAFIDCDCEILQKTLELFLKDHAASAQDCDFMISDEPRNSAKPLFLIGEDGDLALPFSKQVLLSTLEDFQSSLKRDFSEYDAAEVEICALFDEFKAKIIEILRRQNG